MLKFIKNLFHQQTKSKGGLQEWIYTPVALEPIKTPIRDSMPQTRANGTTHSYAELRSYLKAHSYSINATRDDTEFEN